jgi:drug/metabolite transporter (DMT)-like permease
VGGVLSIVSYTIVVWAQSVAPLGVVSALRETDMLAAAGIGYLVFKEPLTTRKVLATLGTLVGIVLIRLST